MMILPLLLWLRPSENQPSCAMAAVLLAALDPLAVGVACCPAQHCNHMGAACLQHPVALLACMTDCMPTPSMLPSLAV